VVTSPPFLTAIAPALWIRVLMTTNLPWKMQWAKGSTTIQWKNPSISPLVSSVVMTKQISMTIWRPWTHSCNYVTLVILWCVSYLYLTCTKETWYGLKSSNVSILIHGTNYSRCLVSFYDLKETIEVCR